MVGSTMRMGSEGVATDETGGLISASKVNGTYVYNSQGDSLGSIYDVMIDKRSGEVAYAVMSFGGFLGIGEEYSPLPWSALGTTPGRAAMLSTSTRKPYKAGRGTPRATTSGGRTRNIHAESMITIRATPPWEEGLSKLSTARRLSVLSEKAGGLVPPAFHSNYSLPPWVAVRPRGKEGQSDFGPRGSSQMLARRRDRYAAALQPDGDAAVVMHHRHFALHGDSVAFR